MNTYSFVVFLHVIAAIGLFAALVIEWMSLRLLQRSASYEQSRESMALWGLVAKVGGPATLIALASGIYLARTISGWNLSWVAVAIPTMVVIAIAGVPSARSRKRLAKLIAVNTGSLPGELRTQLTPRTWTASLRVRTALLLGLVYEMTAKPTEGVLAIVAFAVLGLAWGAMPLHNAASAIVTGSAAPRSATRH
jgi:uncharacterized membrane protein